MEKLAQETVYISLHYMWWRMGASDLDYFELEPMLHEFLSWCWVLEN